MVKKFTKKFRGYLKEILELKTSPHSIAMGFALGTLIAILPTFGLGVFIGLLVILVFKKISKVSMFVSFAFWNPLVLAVLYPLEYWIGDMILLETPIIKFKLEIFNQLFLYSRRLLVGSIILSILMTIIFYIIVLYISDKYQKKRLKSIEEELYEVKEVLKI